MRNVLIALVISVIFYAIGASLGAFPKLNFNKSDGLKVVEQESVVTKVVQTALPSVVTIGIKNTTQTEDQYIGTGFIVSSEGFIVTNRHIVENANSTYKVLTNDKKEFEVKTIYRDPVNDLAILKIDPPQPLVPLALDNSSNAKLGQAVVAIGSPFGDLANTVTIGIVSGLGRGITAGTPYEEYVEKVDNTIQTDAVINSANSGGPLLNSSGRVMGVNTVIADNKQNIGFVIPSNVIKNFIDNLNKQEGVNESVKGASISLGNVLAATTTHYFGTLTAKKPTVSYKITARTGKMDIAFSNNTADLTLTVRNSANRTIGTLRSGGTTKVNLSLFVLKGTYTLSLNPQTAFTSSTQKKGYSIYVTTTARSVTLTPTLKPTLKPTLTPTPTKIIVSPTASSPSPTSPTVQESSRFPGDPNPKVSSRSYWGAGIDGNGSPSRHESPTGKSLSVRRTFWQWKSAINTTSSMYKTVEDDHKNNRLPFISTKTPGWTALANGSNDADLDTMLKKLDSYGKPVWLTIHHEPEGGGGTNSPDDPGGSAAWRLMQKHVRDRMTTLKTKNIAFMPVLMSYTWNPASGRNPEDWWVSGIWDAYIVDHYRDNESGDMFTAHWPAFVAWAEKKGIPFGTGEWGNRGINAQAASEMQAFWDWSFNNKKDVIAYTYFDSGLNSPNGSWSLTGEPLTKFQSIMKNDARVQRINDLR